MTIFLRDQPEAAASRLACPLHHSGALDRLAEGGTDALAAWWLTDRQGRLDYITTPVLPLWHLTAARAGSTEQSPGKEQTHCCLGRELPTNHVGEQWTAWPADCQPPKACELDWVAFWPIGKSDSYIRWNSKCNTNAMIPSSGTLVCTPWPHTVTSLCHPKQTAARQSYHQRGQVTSAPKPPSRRRTSHRALSGSCQMDGAPPLEMLRDSRHHMKQHQARNVQITMVAKLLRELAVHPKQLQVELRGVSFERSFGSSGPLVEARGGTSARTNRSRARRSPVWKRWHNDAELLQRLASSRWTSWSWGSIFILELSNPASKMTTRITSLLPIPLSGLLYPSTIRHTSANHGQPVTTYHLTRSSSSSSKSKQLQQASVTRTDAQWELSNIMAGLVASPDSVHDKLLHNALRVFLSFISITSWRRGRRHLCETHDDLNVGCSTSVDMCHSTEGGWSIIARCRSGLGSSRV